MKKIISLLLTAVVATCALAGCGDSGTHNFVVEDGALKDYTGTGGNAIIPDSVNSIGSDAFDWCERLTRITYKGKTYTYDNIDDLYTAING